MLFDANDKFLTFVPSLFWQVSGKWRHCFVSNLKKVTNTFKLKNYAYSYRW